MVEAQPLNFPAAFCCNCGDTNCTHEAQDTRVTNFLGSRGSETTFLLSVPVCAACRKSTKRRPQGLFSRLLVWALATAAVFALLLLLDQRATLPVWAADHLVALSVVFALIPVTLFFRLRRPRFPQTSFHQPVRIREARLQFGEGQGHVAFMKLAFTNPEYLNVFTTANRDAIQAKRLTAVRA